jgi:hypothetical protein
MACQICGIWRKKTKINNNNSLYPELAPIPVSATTHHPSPSAHKRAVGLGAALP